MIKERISELEDWPIEIIQSEEKRKKWKIKAHKLIHNLKGQWDNIKRSNFCVTWVSEGKERENEAGEKLLWRNKGWKYLKFTEGYTFTDSGTSVNPRRIYTKKAIPRKIIVKLVDQR